VKLSIALVLVVLGTIAFQSLLKSSLRLNQVEEIYSQILVVDPLEHSTEDQEPNGDEIESSTIPWEVEEEDQVPKGSDGMRLAGVGGIDIPCDGKRACSVSGSTITIIVRWFGGSISANRNKQRP